MSNYFITTTLLGPGDIAVNRSDPKTPCPLGALEGRIINNADAWGKKVSDRENSKCKGLEAVVLAWFVLETSRSPGWLE